MDDLNLSYGLHELLPSNYKEDISLKQGSNFNNAYPDVTLDLNNENNYINGIKEVSFRLK